MKWILAGILALVLAGCAAPGTGQNQAAGGATEGYSQAQGAGSSWASNDYRNVLASPGPF